jgi:arginyl-tRNA synthetase
MQFGMLINHLRSQDAEHQSQLEDLEAFYVTAKKRWKEDEQFATEARQTVVKLQAGEPEELRLWHRIIDETRKHYQPLYDRLKVKLGPEQRAGRVVLQPVPARRSCAS